MKRLLFTLLFLLSSLAIQANAAESIAKFSDWQIFKAEKDGTEICYAYTTPFRTKGYEGNRPSAYLLVEKMGPKSFTIGVGIGFNIDHSKDITITTNNTSRMLDDDLTNFGWTFSSNQDVHLINDMVVDGELLEVRSYGTDGQAALDYYSLIGFQKSLNYMNTNCN
jgi:hypothetical protein